MRRRTRLGPLVSRADVLLSSDPVCPLASGVPSVVHSFLRSHRPLSGHILEKEPRPESRGLPSDFPNCGDQQGSRWCGVCVRARGGDTGAFFLVLCPHPSPPSGRCTEVHSEAVGPRVGWGALRTGQTLYKVEVSMPLPNPRAPGTLLPFQSIQLKLSRQREKGLPSMH